MLSVKAVFLRTNIDVPIIKQSILNAQSLEKPKVMSAGSKGSRA